MAMLNNQRVYIYIYIQNMFSKLRPGPLLAVEPHSVVDRVVVRHLVDQCLAEAARMTGR